MGPHCWLQVAGRAQHSPNAQPLSLGTVTLPARGCSVPTGAAKQTRLGGGIRSLLRTGSDKATCGMVVHPGLGAEDTPAPLGSVADLLVVLSKLLLVSWSVCFLLALLVKTPRSPPDSGVKLATSTEF